MHDCWELKLVVVNGSKERTFCWYYPARDKAKKFAEIIAPTMHDNFYFKLKPVY
jgi:hypothetical protein